MHFFSTLQSRIHPATISRFVMLGSACLATTLLAPSAPAQTTHSSSASHSNATSHHWQRNRAHTHITAKKLEVAQANQAPPTPPPPDWPANAKPNPASVVWDSAGLRINASNSSLQQILSEVSTETGTKVEGPVPDQRVYGDYGPGQARDVLAQLLVGSGYNVLLAGDLGHGAPREIVLSPRRAGSSNPQNNAGRPQQDPDEDIPEQPEQPEEQPQPPVQPPQPEQQPQQMQNNFRPGFGPNGPIRTPQQVMEEMQQRQLQQQQQMQQQEQQNQTAPQANPQDQ